MPDKLKESKFKGNEPGGNKNRGIRKASKSTGTDKNAAPGNAKNSDKPKNKGNLNVLKKVKGSNAFRSGNSSKP